MGKLRSHNESMTQYLLGTLPEVEAEQFDDLSITEEQFAESLSAAENDLVDAYVQGELTAEMQERFETHYLASPLRREKVQFAQALQDWNAITPAAVTSKTVSEIKNESWFSSLLAFNSRRLAWGLGGLAVILLVGGSWLIFENRRLRQQVSQTQTRQDLLAERERELQKELAMQRASKATTDEELTRLRSEQARVEQEVKRDREARRETQDSSTKGISVASFILAPQLRGAGQMPTLTVPSGTDYLVMVLELEPNDYRAYGVALLAEAGNRTLWRSNQLRAKTTGDGKALEVRFRAGLLTPHTAYGLRVSGISPDGASEVIGDYQFRIVE